MPSDKRIKEKTAEFVSQAKPEPPQSSRMFLKRLALKPLIIVSLLLCAGVAFAAYRGLKYTRGDIIAPPEGSRFLIKALGSNDKTLLIKDGSRHEIHNETVLERKMFFELITRWIIHRSGK